MSMPTSQRPPFCVCQSLSTLQVRNEKARRFLMNMRKKPGVPFEQVGLCRRGGQGGAGRQQLGSNLTGVLRC